MGRHSTYTVKQSEEICERIAQGETLRAICRDEHMPGVTTVYNWIVEHSEFSERFARAREIGYDMIAMEALAIADTPCVGERTEESESGFKTVREDALGHRKLQVHTRLQLLAKWSGKYREKTETAITGPDGGPVQVDDVTTAARIAALLDRAAKRKAEDDNSDLV